MIKEKRNDDSEIGILIGRFQTPYLSEGHKEIIQYVIDNHPRVFIFLGQSPIKCSQHDPLDFNTRRAMIEESFPDVEIHRIDDVGDNIIWSRDLDKQINLLKGPNQDVILYGSRDSFINSYKGKYSTKELIPKTKISATEIRKSIGIKSKKTREFREGVVWACQNQYNKIYPAVDIAVIKGDTILLGRKPNESKWRFPGGFCEIDSFSYENDAQRVKGRNRLVPLVSVETYMEYVGSVMVDDWRYQNQTDKIRTILFALTKFVGQPEAGDDLEEVKFFTFKHICLNMESLIMPCHVGLVNLFKRWINKKGLL